MGTEVRDFCLFGVRSCASQHFEQRGGGLHYTWTSGEENIPFINDNFPSLDLTEDALPLLKQMCYEYLRIKDNFFLYSGLIFLGFGTKEIFPSVQPINITFPVGNRLRFYEDLTNTRVINNDNLNGIAAFAQTETIDTILTGIAPKLVNAYSANITSTLTLYRDKLLAEIGAEPNDLVDRIMAVNIPTIVGEFNSLVNETIINDYINPLRETITNLDKTVLAEMAESLVYLTFMQKRITFEKESVGGNVDVAVISKGDGFIWIKRKHYFHKELNESFIQNYFKK